MEELVIWSGLNSYLNTKIAKGMGVICMEENRNPDGTPKTFEQAVGFLGQILSSEEKKELKEMAFVSINVKDKTDFFELVISTFKLDGGNDNLLVDIAQQNAGAVLNEDFLNLGGIADSNNGARLILEKLKSQLE